MENALLFTGLLVLAATAGGVIGSACGKKKNAPEMEGRIADLEDRLDALADHVMEQTHAIREMVNEHELLIGETPNDGLLGRVGALEEARRREDLLGRANMLTDNVNVLIDDVQNLKKDLEGLRIVNDAEHHALMENQKGIVKEMREQVNG